MKPVRQARSQSWVMPRWFCPSAGNDASDSRPTARTRQASARIIPNATSYINEGYNPIAFAPDMEKEDRKEIKKLLKPLGKTIETDEAKLEGYAIVSAMLPTYFWFQIEEIQKVAQQCGLSEEEADETVKATLKRAIKLYFDSGLTPSEAMDLIPVKPIGEHETEIKEIYQTKLMGLFEKIKA